MNQQYIYGRRAVLEALTAGRGIEKIFLQFGAEGQGIDDIRIRARQNNVACTIADKAKFNEMEKKIPLERGSAQGVIALATMIAPIKLHQLIDVALLKPAPLLIALDEMNDPYNVGAVARSAECAGASGILLPVDNTAPITPATLKSAAGALEFLPVSRVDNLVVALRDCKAAGFTIIGTDGSAEKLYTESGLYNRPIVLIIGSEGKGMRPAVRRECDLFISIPLSGRVSSLNASAAAAILMFERQRQLQNMD
jgi:23S rRNA (guanosine2251-2'-O)-methyltransferase